MRPVDEHAGYQGHVHAMHAKVCYWSPLRVNLLQASALYPEISGSQHRFTVRFLEWSTVDSRAVQTGHDVPFQLSIC
jgi:cell division FtsZ-interacting protein ZapD